MKKRRLKKRWLITLIVLFVCIGLYVLGGRNESPENKEEIKPTPPIIKEEQKQKKVKITLVGDILFESPLYKDLEQRNSNGDDYFSRINERFFSKDDLTLANMEVPIGTETMKVSGDGFNFCAPPKMGELVARQSIEVLCTANNHTYDREEAGINSTLDFFKNNSNILTVGTYYDEEDRSKPRIVEKNGIKFGFLAYTYGTNIKVPENLREKVGLFNNPSDANDASIYREKMKEEITLLRPKVDVLIVFMHWGNEFTYTPNTQQKNLANFLNELDVDIVVGSHSHCMQPVEWINNNHSTLVYYSLGNFVSADDDISRTPSGQEEFDNAYQVGLLSTLEVSLNDKVEIKNVDTSLVINYFDKDMKNFKLIPYDEYTVENEKSHYRYSYGMTKSWIEKIYKDTIKKDNL